MDQKAHKNKKRNDHFVSQTYLRSFSDQNDFVQIYRKKEKFEKSVPIKSICYELDGDRSVYFENQFGIRDILKLCEPLWQAFIKSIEKENMNDIHSQWSEKNAYPTFLERIMLFISYLRCLSPTTTRLSNKQHEFFLNKIDLPYDSSLPIDVREAIKNRKLEVRFADTKYHKAEALKLLVPIADSLYNKKWFVLVNTTEVKFVTSDTPVVPLFGGLYIPLTPSYALLISSEDGNEMIYKKISQRAVKQYNKELVKYADDIVISSEPICSKLSRLVDNHRQYQPDVQFKEFEVTKNKKLITFQHKAVRNDVRQPSIDV